MKILVIGAGQVGYFLCERLSLEGHAVTLLDRNPERVRFSQDHLNILVIEGNGASAECMERAGIAGTDVLMAVTDQDEVNILACLLGREYGVPKRIARVKSIEYLSRGAVLTKEKLGIDLMINPEDAVADELANLAGREGTIEFAEFAEGEIQFLGYRISAASPLNGLSLRELGDIRGMYRFVVAAITRRGETIIPRGDDVIRAGDSLFIFAHKKELPAIQYLLQIEEEPDRRRGRQRVFILGGGRIGLRLARNLEQRNCEVRLVDHDLARCERISAQLEKTMVLHAEGLDIGTLLDEGVAEADTFIAVTDDDRTNILCALLSKHHGTHRVLALVNMPELLNLAPSLGIDACVSPRLSAAGAILKYVRRGQVLSLATIEGSNSEALEILVKDGSPLIDRPLRELPFPAGAIIGAIVHQNTYEIADGDSRLRAGDRVLLFALPESLAQVERFFE